VLGIKLRIDTKDILMYSFYSFSTVAAALDNDVVNRKSRSSLQLRNHLLGLFE
jgi:hypothetical protein